MSTALLPDLSAACDCVVFLLVRDGQMLLEKRAMHKTSGPGLHSIPGGHVESGESCEQALLREMQEELGVQPLRWQHFCTLYYQTAELQRNHYYLVDDWQGDIQCFEAESLHWVGLDETERLDVQEDRMALQACRQLMATVRGAGTAKET
ncbi:NUDIX domain-containing protein [Aliamphritea spongicola]|uniref:NUDIX domain-containing protein n=1 Tax=Aliamphritea spongicola TaxID=707589 RepID=UPI00196AD478|nr:NUDIX domain-containing protein [Aliamphritea spongicola]